MKANKALTITLALAMILAGTVTAMAGHFGGGGQHGDRGPGGPGGLGGLGPMGLKFIRALDLSDAQKTQVADILKSNLETLKTYMDAVMTAKESLGGVIHEDSATAETVRSVFAAVSSAEENVAVTRFTIMKQIREEVLTEEQLEEMDARWAEHSERAEEMQTRYEEKWSELESWVESYCTSDTEESDTETSGTDE